MARGRITGGAMFIADVGANVFNTILYGDAADTGPGMWPAQTVTCGNCCIEGSGLSCTHHPQQPAEGEGGAVKKARPAGSPARLVSDETRMRPDEFTNQRKPS